MGIANVHGNVFVKKDGEACCVMKVCIMFLFQYSKKKSKRNLHSELNYCEKNPNTCQNGGKCISLTREDGDFACECPSGYRGRNCELMPLLMMTSTTTPAFSPMIFNTTMSPVTIRTTTTTTTPKPTTTERVMVVEATRVSNNKSKPALDDDLLNDNFSTEEINNDIKKTL